jgi:hypothetical protein
MCVILFRIFVALFHTLSLPFTSLPRPFASFFISSEVLDAIRRHLIDVLLPFDQLNVIRSDRDPGMPLAFFCEGEINFPPTYKYQKNSDEYQVWVCVGVSVCVFG